MSSRGVRASIDREVRAMKSLSKWGLLAVAVGGLLFVAGAAAAASRYSVPLIAYWNGSSWIQQTGPNPEGSGSLGAVAAVSDTDVWAVGSYGMPGTDGKALAEHWDGSSWQQVAIPTPGGANEVRLDGIAAVSATDIWAVGSWAGTGTGEGYASLTEHWNGSSWTIVASPRPGYNRWLSGVAALSGTDVWAVGTYGRSVAGLAYFHTLVLHWNGTKWTRVKSPHPGWHSANSRLAGVAALSPRSVWAVGTYSGRKNSRTLTLHWNGRQWKQVASPNVLGRGNELSAVAAVGRDNVWAVGGPGDGKRGQPLAEHWTGYRWQIVPVHSGYPNYNTQNLTSIAALAANNIWAAGQHQDSADQSHSTLCEHWNGRAWARIPGPNPAAENWFSGIAAASPIDVWAVGTYFPAPFN
jgi:hypothetical protein